MMRPARPVRIDGYAPIGDYAAIGDGRTVALVARDGAIDWLCLPDLDSPSVFAALLDAQAGGSFLLAPVLPFEVTRRYLPGTNVLETMFVTGEGRVRVTDAMLLPRQGLAPMRELVRRVDGLAGRVHLRWVVTPTFGDTRWVTQLRSVGGLPIATARSDALAVCAWNAGQGRCRDGAVRGAFAIGHGERALLAVVGAHQEPVVVPSRAGVEARLAETIRFWQHWSDLPYQGPWRTAVQRSALALKLLVHSPTGAVAAAATTSLPEQIGGARNWDYRFC